MKTTISHKRSRPAAKGSPRAGRPGTFKRITAAVLMCLLAGATALAVSSPARAADDDTANYSFYKLSSSLAAFFSNAQSPDEKAETLPEGVWNSVLENPGNAGSMLGYVDPDFSFSMEFLNSQISGSSAAVGYNTLVKSTQGGGGGTDTPGLLDYAHFGATLNALGLDSMSTGLSLNIFLPIAGGLMMLFYIFTGVVDMIFTGIITTLKTLNPFTLFYAGVQAVSPEFASGMTGGQAPPGFLGGLSTWIGQWYRILNDMSWTVLVPLFIGVLVLGLLLSKKMDRGSAIRKLIIRLVFIGVGLPLIGSMYTGVLNSMGDTSKSGSAGSTQVVLSTYVDFQNWALKNRLAVPSGATIAWDATGHKPTTDAVARVRDTALAINKSTNPAWAGINSAAGLAADESWTAAAIEDSGARNPTGGINGYMATIDLLARYMGGAKVEAATFETAAKGDISTSQPFTNGADGKKTVNEWFTKFGDPKKGLPEITDEGTVSGNPVITVADNSGLKASPRGVTSGTKTFTSPTASGCYEWVSYYTGNPRACNMAPLALYNYLNTSFGSDSMTMYSSNKATSGATREMHSAVTQVGTGTMSGLYWLNSIVLLASFVVIGVGYALSMLFSNIKRSFQLVTAIPFATIGAVPAIAKVVIYTLAMILEIIVTLFIYRFMQVFLISIPQIVEMPFSKVLSSGPLGDPTTVNLLSGGTLPLVMTVLSIIALIIFTVLALRTRKTLVKSINEAVTKMVDKFMETSIAPPGGKGGMMPALAGGMAQGAGMAAANKIMTGGPGGGSKKSVGQGAGPGGIATGGVPAAGGPGGPNASGPAGALTVGGSAGMDVSGDVGGPGPDGTPGGSPSGDGNGNPGSPLALGPGPSGSGPGGIAGADSNDQSTAKAVAAQGGLSEGPARRESGDITDSMAASLDQSREQYAAKDKAAARGAVSGGKAVLKGAEAAGRGMAGDAAGAASAGNAAADHARDARSGAEQAKSIGKDTDSPASALRAGGTAAAASALTQAASTRSSATETGPVQADKAPQGITKARAGKQPTPASAAPTGPTGAPATSARTASVAAAPTPAGTRTARTQGSPSKQAGPRSASAQTAAAPAAPAKQAGPRVAPATASAPAAQSKQAGPRIAPATASALSASSAQTTPLAASAPSARSARSARSAPSKQAGPRSAPVARSSAAGAPTQSGPRVAPSPRPTQRPQQARPQAPSRQAPVAKAGNGGTPAARPSQAPAAALKPAPRQAAPRTTPAARPTQRPQQTRPQAPVKPAPKQSAAPRTAPVTAPRLPLRKKDDEV